MIPYKYIGFLRGLGVVILIAVLGYVGNAANWAFLENPWLAGLIAAVAAAIEHNIEDKKGRALFGAVKV